MDDFKDYAGMNYLMTAIEDVAKANAFDHHIKEVTLVFMTKTKTEAWNCIDQLKRNIHPALVDLVKFRDRTVMVNNKLRIYFTSEEDQRETRTYQIQGR